MKTTTIFVLSMLMAAFTFGEEPVEKVIQVTTTVTENPPAISFQWNQIPGHFDILIFRKSKNSDSWGNAIATLPVSTLSFTDNEVTPGINYEYAIKAKYYMPIETYINAGIKCRENEYRGKLILLVDSTFVDDLKNELIRYESDLIGDGWQVLRKDIDRNASVIYVKSVIRDFYNADPENVNSVFLFGHIPVPYSGINAYDGHTVEHDGAWPADMYYGSMNEKLWSDTYITCITATRPENRNVPGDGKFDVCILPNKEIISLSVGRVDFYDLPAFPQSEAELLRNYLNKNHDFRHKIIDPKMQALVDDNFGIKSYSGIIEVFSISGWRNFSALLNFQNIKKGDFLSDTKDDSYIWSYGCGGGKFDSCVGIGNTDDFVTQRPKTVFTALYGSRFGDWDSQNNFMRAALASNGWILTSCWAGRPHYTFHQMGMGETIGNCVRTTQNINNNNDYYAGLTNRGTHTSLLGDPTLRMHIIRPVNSLKPAITKDNSVILSWNQAEDSIVGYYIYKLDTLTKKYVRISDSPVTETFFEDLNPVEGNNYYMVRTLKLSKVASGSYFNLSQGIFDTIRFELQTPALVSQMNESQNPESGSSIKINEEFNVETQISASFVTNAEAIDVAKEVIIYPNPSTGLFNVSFGSSAVKQATLKVYDLHGRILHTETFQNSNTGSFDISALPKGIYMVKGIIGNKKMVTKISLQ
ncbi:MAG: T9SS type A sorting domain-containing protein [Draconibacterium sp.]|nr:T9SS type A sorting domain-containing protein [Draconibacterium sp.]